MTAQFDLAVIGGGSGGYAAARTAAAAGLRTAVIDGARELGGLCILRGCMPTKALLSAAEVLHRTTHPQAWGISSTNVGFDFAAVMARKDALIREFAEYRQDQLAKGRFTLVRAQARFVSPHEVALSNGGSLTADHFIISTGSTTAHPPLPGLAATGCLTSDDALSLSRLPASLIILGGGAIAMEFAQFFARFRVAVTVIQRGQHVLRDFDPDAATVVEEVLRREGVTIHTGTELREVTGGSGNKRVRFLQAGREVTVSAAEILLAQGRVPNTAGLDLAAAGVAAENGRIVTDEEMRTSAPHIFAAGDCTGKHEIVHIAIQQGEIAAHNVAQPTRPRRMDYRLLTSVVFTEPQVGVVGLTESRARAEGIPYLAAAYPFADHGKSMIMEARDGFVKLLADPHSGEILGGACVGPQGGELIHEIIAGMSKRMTVGELAVLPHYHPTLAEIWTYPAEELAAKIPAS